MKSISARQYEILELLRSKPTMKVWEIQERLHVSQATMYRDLRQLIAAGLILRTGGSVHRVMPPQTLPTQHPLCLYCNGSVPDRTLFLMQTKPNEQLFTCCPHCGLLALEENIQAVSAMATDFIFGNIVNARQAVYLVNSRVILCCAPSVLSFTKTEDALSFQQGFGGQIFSFNETRQRLYQQASLLGITHYHSQS